MEIANMVKLFEDNDIKISNNQARKLTLFCDFLLKKNEEFNLTAIVEFSDVVVKHLVDSLKLNSLMQIKLGVNFLDIGAGAGFPSVPLAIVRPDLKIVQLDCLQKRVKFLHQVARLLDLNVEIVHGRAEELGKQTKFREKFQFVTARAVTKLNRLLEYALPFVEVGGYFVALKGKNYEDELTNSHKAIEKLGGKLEKVEKFKLSNKMQRCLIIVKKISQTPTIYPRINSKILKYEL